MKIESAYSSKIDCRINYNDEKEMIALFEEAKTISSASVYRFLEELAYQPIRLSKPTLKRLTFVLNYVDKNFTDPFKKIALSALVLKFDGKHLPLKKGLVQMQQIRVKKQYALLNIISSAIKRNRNTYMVENFYQSIITEYSKTI